MSAGTSYNGVLHHYTKRLVAFEWTSADSTQPAGEDVSTIVFVGGLFDDLLTVPFIPLLAANLPPNWRVVQARLSSSSSGWGFNGLDRDVKEIGQCVSYIRHLRPGGKVILMGHSTGSQDTMHYAISPLGPREKDRPAVDGYILQGSCSDREGMALGEPAEAIQKTVDAAKEYVARGDAEEILPKKLTGFMFPVSARRYLSLASPEHDGQDDMFSTDLSDERLAQLFGKLGQSKIPVSILYMGADQYVPPSVDKEALVARWVKIIQEHGGNVHSSTGVVPDHDHNGENVSEEVRMGLVKRVIDFAKAVGWKFGIHSQAVARIVISLQEDSAGNPVRSLHQGQAKKKERTTSSRWKKDESRLEADEKDAWQCPS